MTMLASQPTMPPMTREMISPMADLLKDVGQEPKRWG
jgi:hypothetical protein